MEARKKETPTWTATMRKGQDAFTLEKEMETSIFFSKDRKKIRLADNIGNQMSIPVSCLSRNNPIVFRSWHGFSRIPFGPCGCYGVLEDGEIIIVRPNGCTLPHP